MTADPNATPTPTERLPLYVQPERRRVSLPRMVRVRPQLGASAVVLAALAGLAGVAALVLPHTDLAALAYRGIVGFAGAVVVGDVAGRIRRRRAPGPTDDLPGLWFFPKPPGHRRRAVWLWLLALVVDLPLVGIALWWTGSGTAAAVAGISAGLAVEVALSWRRLRRIEDASGWWLLRPPVILGQAIRWSRTFAGDGVVPLWGGITLPRPVAELNVAALPPMARWAVLHGTGQTEAALGVAVASYTPVDPTWGGWAALSALALDRADEAEQWLQRTVDDGYRGHIEPWVARALRPLHHTDAWKALRRQTRRR